MRTVIMWSSALAGVLLSSACVQILGIEELSPREQDMADAGPGDAQMRFVVRGTAVGLLEPVSLRLEHSGGNEVLSVVEDGPFAFESELSDNTSYVVELIGSPPCAIGRGAGVIEGAPPMIELVCDSVALSDLRASGPATPAIEIVPTRAGYSLDVSVLQQDVRVTATTADPRSTVTVAGARVTSGQPSAPIALNLGDNVIDIVVSNENQAARAYQLTVRRAAALAQYAYGKASNTGNNDIFGTTVALWGDLLAVGAPFEASAATGIDGDQGDDSAFGSGAVYVFRRTGNAWAQEAYIKASNTSPGDEFGASVALWEDTLAVGAPFEASAATGVGGNQGNDNAEESGAVYVFRRTDGAWAQEAYVKAFNTEPGDLFGTGVALYEDTLVVGAPGEDSSATGVNGAQNDNAAPSSGAAYVYRRAGNAWSAQAYVKASNTDAGDELGSSVAAWGDTLAAGAPGEASAATGVDGDQADDTTANSGAVYVFRRAGDVLAQEGYLKASNTGAGDGFGSSVALSGDVLAIGAPFEASAATGVDGDQADDTAPESGATYVFRRAGATWAQEGYLKASNGGAGDRFGAGVALSGDTLAIGAPTEDGADTGVGGDQDDDAAGESGAVYVFHRAGDAWAQGAYVKASNTGTSDRFGGVVALSGDTLAAGAFGEDSTATGVGGDQDDDGTGGSGAVYVFH